MTDDPPPSVVLVVEDELILRMRAVDIVEDAGFTPIEAINADGAIRIIEARDDVSVLFTDIQMPGSMDGLKLNPADNLGASGDGRNRRTKSSSIAFR